MTKREPAIDWLVRHKDYDGSDCLIWPYSRLAGGYGNFGHLRTQYYAHRYMCELVNGPAPLPSHEAAHECGNGHLGCVHPKHLKWKTRQENAFDRVRHGNAGKSKIRLTAQQVAEIKLLIGTMPQATIAAKFGVSIDTISAIKRGEVHRDGPRRYGIHIDPDKRAGMVKRAREMRLSGATYKKISVELGVARLTARTLSHE